MFQNPAASTPGKANLPPKIPSTLSAMPTKNVTGSAQSSVSGEYALIMARVSPARSRQRGIGSGPS